MMGYKGYKIDNGDPLIWVDDWIEEEKETENPIETETAIENSIEDESDIENRPYKIDNT